MANKLKASKAEFVNAVLQQEGLRACQAALVENDPAERASMRQPQAICRAVFVRKQQGMMEADMEDLRQLAAPRARVAPETAATPQAEASMMMVPPRAGAVQPKAFPEADPPFTGCLFGLGVLGR